MAIDLDTDRGIVRASTGTWTVDRAHSSVEFRVKHMMVSTVRGQFTEFEGTIEAAPGYHDSQVRGAVETASINTNESRRDEHLCSEDFFDAERYPTISFESTSVEHLHRGDYWVAGELTMHGETRLITFDVTVHGAVRDRDPDVQERVGLEVRGTVSRSEFGLRWQRILESDGVAVADEVRIAADLSAICTRRDG